MAQLAEAYIHLKPFYVSAEQLKRLGLATDELARAAALRIYDQQPVAIEVELIEGTLWAKIKVTGAIIFTVYTGYSSIDGAIATTERLCKKANIFGDYVCSSFIKESGATPDQVVSIQHRLKTPGKLRRVLLRIDRLDKAASHLSKLQLQERLHKAHHELKAAMEDLTVEEASELKNTLKSLPHLPPVAEWPSDEPPQTPNVMKQAKRPLSPQQELLVKEQAAVSIPIRKRLEYHNKFEVLPSEASKVRHGR
jgi:hypothetical protein